MGKDRYEGKTRESKGACPAILYYTRDEIARDRNGRLVLLRPNCLNNKGYIPGGVKGRMSREIVLEDALCLSGSHPTSPAFQS